ncbi:MAG: hypothetical protein ACD_65C00285G0001 [uncultured bacterium]|nr:MAG: hypothetical protein ACD_65C00285G0001 [uncultured bacterium]
MPRNSFSFAVLISRHPYYRRCSDFRLKTQYHLLLIGRHYIFRCKIFLGINPHYRLRKISYVTHRGLNNIIMTEKFRDHFSLSRRLNYHEIFRYSHLEVLNLKRRELESKLANTCCQTELNFHGPARAA